MGLWTGTSSSPPSQNRNDDFDCSGLVAICRERLGCPLDGGLRYIPIEPEPGHSGGGKRYGFKDTQSVSRTHPNLPYRPIWH